MKLKIICITSLQHLPNVFNKLQDTCEVTYVPDIKKNELRSLLLNNNFDAIFTNPNKQNFKLDYDLLKETTVKLINTASTGINHIIIDDCEKLGIKIIKMYVVMIKLLYFTFTTK